MKSGELPLKTQLSRLMKVRNAIKKAPPEKLNMKEWATKEGRFLRIERAREEFTLCGTTFCIGGFAACLAPQSFIDSLDTSSMSMGKIGQLWLFGNTSKSIFEESLFFVEKWPTRYRNRYYEDNTRNHRKSVVLSYLTYRIYNLQRRILRATND